MWVLGLQDGSAALYIPGVGGKCAGDTLECQLGYPPLSLCPLSTGSFFAFIAPQFERRGGDGEKEGLVGSWTPGFRGPSFTDVAGVGTQL